LPDPEEPLVTRLLDSYRDDEQITLILGSGIGGTVQPRPADMVRLADQYATGRGDAGDLIRALDQARERAGERSIDIDAAYRQAFARWVSGAEFDVIAQEAVLGMYHPPDRMATSLVTHGIWQRVSRDLGESLENDEGSWRLAPGVEALGAILARAADHFGNQVITTNFDPAIEVAVRAANGRTVSVPVDRNGAFDRSAGHDGAIRVFHLHGYWRPMVDDRQTSLIHDPARFPDRRTIRRIAALIKGDTVLVLGTSDWSGTIVRALAEVARQRPVRVLWAQHSGDLVEAERRRNQLAAEGVAKAECVPGVGSEQLFTALARALHVGVGPRAESRRHRVRHALWEREFVSQPGNVPPETIPRLLAQLERRFGWDFRAVDGTPDLVFWPLRLRAKASVIHMAQALAAGALTARGARLVVSLDDFGIHEPAPMRAAFEADLVRWIRHTGPGATPEFVSLSEFIEEQRLTPSPEQLLRPTDPWAVARDFYGEHNPSLYSVLVAIKALPNVSLDELAENSTTIVQALLRKNANRLITPMTRWSFLHHLLLTHASPAVITLCGRDEALFWEQWREVYGFGLSALYNPYIRSLSNSSGMMRWSSLRDLRTNLADLYGLPGWDQEHSYIPWLFHNAVLLPVYLTHGAAPVVEDVTLDSWAAFLAATEAGLPALDVLADYATDLYLGELPPAAAPTQG